MNSTSGNAASVGDLSVLLRLTAALGRTEHAAEFCEAALCALEEGLGVRRAAVVLVDADGVMRFKAWRGLSDAYRTAAEGHGPWAEGETAAAPIMAAEPARVPELRPLLPALAAEGIASLAFIPLVIAGRVIGRFMLYFDTPRALDPAELTFAQIIGSQVAFAIERTTAHRAVRESEERLRFALDAASLGTWDWDLRTGRVEWSESLERCHGLERGTFGGTFADFAREIHPDDRERVLGALRAAMEGGPAYNVEYRVSWPDGSIQWLETQGRVHRDAAGRPVRMSGICMNVTARKRVEEARLEAPAHSHGLARRLAAIVESSDDAIFSKDLDGRIASWNPAAERMFGYTADEAIGQSIRLIVPPDRYEEEDEVLRRIRQGMAVEHADTIRRRKDGRLIEVELTVSPVRDAAGAVTGASSIARDITAKKQSEQELADLHRRLTTLIAASTSLLDTPSTSRVHAATIGIARELLAAEAHAIWRLGDEGWRVMVSEGVSPAYAATTFPPGTELPGAARWGRPLVVPDVQSEPALRHLRQRYADEGIRAMLVCPMRFGAERPGLLVFYYRTPHPFTDVEVRTAQALANLASSATTTAELYDEQRRQRHAAEHASRQAALLAEVGAVLARSLDYRATLTAVATLAVPAIADWCAVDMVGPNGEPERLAIAHTDPSKVRLARELSERYPMGPERPGSPAHVIRTGQPVLIETVTDEMLDEVAVDAEHRRLLRELSLASYICVPVISPRRILGAITFVFADSGRHYRAQDVRFAEEVALRASLAIENANAYERVQEANRLKDDFLATLSHELRTPLNAILGYAQMLNMGLLPEHRQRQAFAVVRRNAESLKQIIDDILDVSRIIAGKLRLNVQPVELDAILKDAAATLQPAADAKGVQLEAILEPGVPPVS
ncbi:MAG TPA: PAS domain S-box protein, partial [Vicinamibacterales bacterium]